MRKSVIILLWLFIPAMGQANTNDEKAVVEIMNIARDRIAQAKLADGSFVPAETAEEKKTAIIPVADGKRVIHEGMRSALVEWCGLDRQSSYLRFMQHERTRKVWSDKQIAYIGLLHGVATGITRHQLKNRDGCSAGQKAQLMKMGY